MADVKNKSRIVKVVVLGDSGVGKTSLIQQYVTGHFNPIYKTTIGVDFQEKHTPIDGSNVCIQIWDTAGQERFHSVSTQFYRNADACMIVFDVTAKTSFTGLSDWLTDFLAGINSTQTLDDTSSVPVILIGNKSDQNAAYIEVQDSMVEKWCDSNNGIKYIKASAKTGANVAVAFEELAKMVLKNPNSKLTGNEDVFADIVTHDNIVDDGGKKKCC